MPTKDGFDPDHHLPIFLAERAGEPEQRDTAVVSSRILKTSILVIAATAIGIEILSVGDPMTLFANVAGSLVDMSSLRPRSDQSTPAIQSAADVAPLPPTSRDAPTRDEMTAAVEPADRGQNEIRQTPTDALFKQFQAWAAEEDARAQVRSVQPVQPVQEAPAQVAEDVQAPVRPAHRHRRLRLMQNARAEMRAAQYQRARVRRAQNARVQVRPAQDARAQDQAVQNAPAPSLLQSLGLRN